LLSDNTILLTSTDDLAPCKHLPSTSLQLGNTALITASSEGYSSVVRKLLHARAAVNTTNNVRSDSCLVRPVRS